MSSAFQTLGGFINRKPAERVAGQPVFVLRTRPWSETSLLVDLLSRDFGRVRVRARGAKRPTSPWRGILAEFCPLVAAWSGSGATKTLTKLEWMGGFAPVEGEALLSAFYVNELVMRFTALEDPQEGLFEAYWEALRVLSGQRADVTVEAALRIFEMRLLALSGYGLPRTYEEGVFELRGAELVRVAGAAPDNATCFSAQVLRDIVKFDFSKPATARAAKALLRAVLASLAGDKPLHTRRILSELRRL